MSKKNYTHIIALIDRSGSMCSIRTDMEGGFNEFVQKQKEVEGEATLTLVKFDDQYDMEYENVDISEVPEFQLNPRGMTALLDAMGTALNAERDRINDMDEEDQPEKVICVVITDGYENSSKEYTREQVNKMVEALQDEEDVKWDFAFLGANMDAIAEGGSLGVRSKAAYTYDATSEGTRVAFASLATSTAMYRTSAATVDYAFVEDESVEKEEADKAIPSKITDL